MSIRHEHTLLPGKGHHPGITKALVFPMNATMQRTAGLNVADVELMEMVREYLSAQGVEAVVLSGAQFSRASDIAARSVRRKNLSGESGVASGDVQFEDIVPTLVEELSSDAQIIVMPNVMIRSADYSGGRLVRWDGVRRRERGTQGGQMTGQTSGGSLYTVIYDRTGTRIFSAYGGLDLIYELNMRKKKYELRLDLFDDQENLSEGVCTSFHPYFGDDVDC